MATSLHQPSARAASPVPATSPSPGAPPSRGAQGVRLRVDERWVLTVPLDRYTVRPLLPDGSLGEPLDGLSPCPARVRVLDLDGQPVLDAVAARFAEPDTELDALEVQALPPALAGLLSAGATYAATARGRAMLAAAHRGIAADVAQAHQVDRDVSIWRTVHATSVHAAGTPLAAIPAWLALQPRDAAVAWRAGTFGAAPVPVAAPTVGTSGALTTPGVPGGPGSDSGRPPAVRPLLQADPSRSRDAAQVRARAAEQQGHGYAKPALSVGLTMAMALAVSGCGGGDDDDRRSADQQQATCINRDTQEVLSDEFCDRDGERAYPGGFALLVFGGGFFNRGGRSYARDYSTSRAGSGSRSGGGFFGGGSRGTGGG